jgi:REP element-mobilizing transposase RayT
MLYSDPLAYFITFTVRNSWLHGDERGSYRKGGEFIPPSPDWVRMNLPNANESPLLLSPEQRTVIATAIDEVCMFRGWTLYEQNVRTNHVHIVVAAKDVKPEKIMNDIKARATRRLRETGLFADDKKLWTEHGSTKYLFTEEALTEACRYVREDQ